MKRLRSIILVVSLLLIFPAQSALISTLHQAARETAEFLMNRYSKELSRESVEHLTQRIGSLAQKHGDETFAAIRKTGPQSLQWIAEAGESSPQIIRLLTKHGQAAGFIISNPRCRNLFLKWGEESANVMLSHPGIAETLIERHGADAIKALKLLDGQQGRRLAMLSEEGLFTYTKQAERLMPVIERFGNQAMDFIWKHKGSLAIATVLAAFLRDPEPFISGTKDLAEITAGPVARSIAQQVPWQWFIPLLAAVLTGLFWWRRKSTRTPNARSPLDNGSVLP